MYFATVGFYVWFEAGKNRLRVVAEATASIPNLSKEGITFILPITVLVGLL